MRHSPKWPPSLITVAATLALLLSVQANAAVILSDNLSATTADTESASGATWLAASFGTSTDALSLTSATLLLSATGSGNVAQLSLYSDGGLQPGTLLGTFTSPLSFATTLSPAVFTASGLSVAANSTYWIVLQGVSGEFNWAWTLDNTGSGSGSQHTWALSSNAGGVWFSSDIYPTQFAVSADTTVSAVPEPGTVPVISAVLVAALIIRWHRMPGPPARP